MDAKYEESGVSETNTECITPSLKAVVQTDATTTPEFYFISPTFPFCPTHSQVLKGKHF